MRLTDEQHRDRKTGIGGSEIGALIGVSPWRTPLDIYISKTESPSVRESPFGPADMGHLLEPVMIDAYGRITGERVVVWDSGTIRKDRYAFATPDAVTIVPGVEANLLDYGRLIECKAVGARTAARWDDGPPPYVVAQCIWQMGVTHIKECDVVAMLDVTQPPNIYPVVWDEGLWEQLYAAAVEFVEQYIDRGVPPPPGKDEDRAEYFTQRFRMEGKGERCASLADQSHAELLIENYLQAQQDVKVAEQALSDAKASLMEFMGDYASATIPGARATWTTQQGAPRYKPIAEALGNGSIPIDLLDQYRGEPVRVLRVRRMKG